MLTLFRKRRDLNPWFVAWQTTALTNYATFPSFKTNLIMLNLYQILAFTLFLIGIMGIVVNRKNLIIMLMSIELMLLAINFLFIIYSSLLDNIFGQIFALYVLVVAAAESAIGLSILVAYYRVRGTISVKFLNLLRG